ncbi:MAG: hypothetical protein KJ062_09730 [Thermoanaerobaculia bacterium]|nr:hypothetical protein [Thermoanaerobaculia bacterium]
MTRGRSSSLLRAAPALLAALTGLRGACVHAAQGPAAGAASVAAEASAAAMRWTDPDGKPLPFRTDEELLEFLRSAAIRKEKELATGITRPLKLLLEKDGVRANAIFRSVNEERKNVSFASGKAELLFRDSYLFEAAAYELSRILGLDNVPPVTLRKLGHERGSVQIWVEGAMTEADRLGRKLEPPDVQRWDRQIQTMNVFDAVVCNTDRHKGNVLITPDWKVWMIDHTRAFRMKKRLQSPEGLNQCDRRLFARLASLDEALVTERLKPYLKGIEIEALLARSRAVVERLKTLISERGEALVLYDLDEPVSPPKD